MSVEQPDQLDEQIEPAPDALGEPGKPEPTPPAEPVDEPEPPAEDPAPEQNGAKPTASIDDVLVERVAEKLAAKLGLGAKAAAPPVAPPPSGPSAADILAAYDKKSADLDKEAERLIAEANEYEANGEMVKATMAAHKAAKAQDAAESHRAGRQMFFQKLRDDDYRQQYAARRAEADNAADRMVQKLATDGVAAQHLRPVIRELHMRGLQAPGETAAEYYRAVEQWGLQEGIIQPEKPAAPRRAGVVVPAPGTPMPTDIGSGQAGSGIAPRPGARAKATYQHPAEDRAELLRANFKEADIQAAEKLGINLMDLEQSQKFAAYTRSLKEKGK